MAKQHGKFNCTDARLLTDDEGRMTFSVTVDPEFRYVVRQMMQAVKLLINAGKSKLVISVHEYKNTRSLEQNALMWKLLEIMAEHKNVGRTGGVTAMDCYLDMLAMYGAKFEYLECTKEALPALQEMFRTIKVVEERKDGKTVMCKAYIGSSKFDTKEMTLLIEGIMDRLAEMGVDSSEWEYVREDWQAS